MRGRARISRLNRKEVVLPTSRAAHFRHCGNGCLHVLHFRMAFRAVELGTCKHVEHLSLMVVRPMPFTLGLAWLCCSFHNLISPLFSTLSYQIVESQT